MATLGKKINPGSTEYLGVDSKIDFDILLWRQMERINSTEDLEKKVVEIDDLHLMLSVWSEEEQPYNKAIEEIKDNSPLWNRAHMHGPAFNFYKKKYIYIKYKALMGLMHRLSIIGELGVIPRREERTTL